MRHLSEARLSRVGLGAAGGGTPLDTKGFTSADLKLLQEAHHRGVIHRGWGRAQFATNEFSHYLAIWNNAATGREPPSLVIARFWKTGTYALLVHGKIVANSRALGALLPSLAIAGSTPDEE